MESNTDISLSIEQGLEAKELASSTRSYEDAKEACLLYTSPSPRDH